MACDRRNGNRQDGGNHPGRPWSGELPKVRGMLAFTSNGYTEAAGGDLALGASGGGHRGTDGDPTGFGGDAWLSEPPRGVQTILSGKGGAVFGVVGALGPELAGRSGLS